MFSKEQYRIDREKEFHNEIFASGKRERVKKYYDTTTFSKEFYKKLIQKDAKNKKVLEYGCGPGSQSFTLARMGFEVFAIDISDVAIDLASKMAHDNNLNINFRVMNAEELQFDDNTFDKVCGSGILHHLDLEKAYNEVFRVLKNNGTAFFFEPLGHNPIINYYRNRTPGLRTVDEHPLMLEDIEMAKDKFREVKVHYFHLSSIAASIVPNVSLRKITSKILNKFDGLLFKTLPFLKKHAWIVVLELKK